MTTYPRKPDLVTNNIADTDSYKFSHWVQYPDGMDLMFSYLESRGGEFADCTLSGLQVALHRYLSKPVTLEDIAAEEKWALAHGEPFNREGWLHVLHKYGGKMPVRIRAIPEGLIVPVCNAIMTIESVKDPKCFWITNWLETKLVRLWYPSTVAIISREIKKAWKSALKRSSEDPEGEIAFKHHDFGSRGVTCFEQGELGAMAHLLNFQGSDTVGGVKCAAHYYDHPMPGFSIPATEHSTMTVWGKEHELEALKNWVQKMLVERQVPPGVPKMAACVGDSYDIYEFTRTVCRPEIIDMLQRSGGTLVVRPDSGSPLTVLPRILELLLSGLPEGSVSVNSKGFKVLPPYVRLIWGDGINRRSMKNILLYIMEQGWSVSNVAFGSGGGLLQDCDRDTQKYAFKCSYAEVNNRPVDVRKDPITAPDKRSKAGRLDLIKNPLDGKYETVVLKPTQLFHPCTVMNTVFEWGDITYHATFDECRARMAL